MRRLAATLLLLPAVHAVAQPVGDSTREPDQPLVFPDSGYGVPMETTDAGAAQASPAFTQDQQFTNTRLWILDTGTWTVEQWWTGNFGTPREFLAAGGTNDQLFQTVVGLGLLPHLQLDVGGTVDLNQSPSDQRAQLAPWGMSGVTAELRIAFGSAWNQIWGNPVLDLELDGRFSEPTKLRARALAGGELFVPRLLGALNVQFARNSFRDNTIGIDYQIEAEAGLNYELLPDVFRLGVEATVGFDSHDDIDVRGYTQLHPVAQVGPQLLLTEPKRRIKLLAAVLFGLADWDPPVEPQVMLSTSF